MKQSLAIIGAGNMAEAIARGVIRGGVFKPNEMIAADISPQRRALFSEEMGIATVESNAEAVRSASRILLSVKPQKMAGVLAEIGPVLNPSALVISIAAGISAAYIEKNLGAAGSWRVIRAMPNTPMLVGEGMVAIARGTRATAADVADARQIFEAAATIADVSEDKIDAVTAVSGSGPAYFFYLVEQMVHAGVELGLTPEQAHQLATQTALGAAKMLTSSGDSPQELRRKVTSPGGTTNAAITHLESNGVGASIVEAIKAAERRSKELGM